MRALKGRKCRQIWKIPANLTKTKSGVAPYPELLIILQLTWRLQQVWCFYEKVYNCFAMLLDYMRQNVYYRNLKWSFQSFVATLLSCNKGQQWDNPFACFATYLSRQRSGHGMNCKLITAMTPEQWTWLLCSVSVIPRNKLSLHELNLIGIKLLTSGFLEIF